MESRPQLVPPLLLCLLLLMLLPPHSSGAYNISVLQVRWSIASWVAGSNLVRWLVCWCETF